MQADTLVANQTIRIPTTAAQDKAMQDFIAARRNNPGIYDLNDRNCATTVRDVLRAGGVNTSETIFPKILMRNLQHNFGSGR